MYNNIQQHSPSATQYVYMSLLERDVLFTSNKAGLVTKTPAYLPSPKYRLASTIDRLVDGIDYRLAYRPHYNYRITLWCI